MRQTWSVDLDGQRHSVEYRRPWWSHRGAILLDGNEVATTAEPWLRLGVDHPFSLAGHNAVIHIRMGAASLTVDGRSPDTGFPAKVSAPLPLGLFALAIAVVVLPISLGNGLGWGLAAIPAGVVGGAGGGLVMAIGSRGSWSRRKRMTLGAITAVAAVALSLVVGSALTRLTPIPSEEPFANWSRFDVPGGGFSLAFPSTPSSETTEQSSGSMTMEIHTFVWEDRSAAFGAVFTDYSAEIAAPETALSAIVEDIVVSNGGTLVDDHPVTAYGMTGREVTIAVPKAGANPAFDIRARLYLRAQRYYAITAIVKGASAADVHVDAFLDSFVLDDATPS